MRTTTTQPSGARWRKSFCAALISIVTMPLTAVWFLLVGGVLLVTSLAIAATRNEPVLGVGASVGLGLLAGPAVYLGLAVAA